jgi:hypothetical protein
MHRTAAQKMQMHVVHRLAAILARIHHRAEALRESILFGDLLRHRVQVSQQPLIAGRKMRQRRNMLARNQQHMHRRLRMNVREGYCIVVFIKLLCRNLSRGDLAEQAIHGHQLTAAYFLKNRGCVPGFQGS